MFTVRYRIQDGLRNKHSPRPPVAEAMMLQVDLSLFDNKYDLLSKWLPSLPPSKHVVERCLETDPEVVPILGGGQEFLAYGI
jgi:hypothetical protein